MFKAHHVVLGTKFVRYIKTNKVCYDYGEDIPPEKLRTTELDKYSVLLNSLKWNKTTPKITYCGTVHSSGKTQVWKP